MLSLTLFLHFTSRCVLVLAAFLFVFMIIWLDANVRRLTLVDSPFSLTPVSHWTLYLKHVLFQGSSLYITGHSAALCQNRW